MGENVGREHGGTQVHGGYRRIYRRDIIGHIEGHWRHRRGYGRGYRETWKGQEMI